MTNIYQCLFGHLFAYKSKDLILHCILCPARRSSVDSNMVHDSMAFRVDDPVKRACFRLGGTEAARGQSPIEDQIEEARSFLSKLLDPNPTRPTK